MPTTVRIQTTGQGSPAKVTQPRGSALSMIANSAARGLRFETSRREIGASPGLLTFGESVAMLAAAGHRWQDDFLPSQRAVGAQQFAESQPVLAMLLEAAVEDDEGVLAHAGIGRDQFTHVQSSLRARRVSPAQAVATMPRAELEQLVAGLDRLHQAGSVGPATKRLLVSLHGALAGRTSRPLSIPAAKPGAAKPAPRVAAPLPRNPRRVVQSKPAAKPNPRPPLALAISDFAAGACLSERFATAKEALRSSQTNVSFNDAVSALVGFERMARRLPDTSTGGVLADARAFVEQQPVLAMFWAAVLSDEDDRGGTGEWAVRRGAVRAAVRSRGINPRTVAASMPLSQLGFLVGALDRIAQVEPFGRNVAAIHSGLKFGLAYRDRKEPRGR